MFAENVNASNAFQVPGMQEVKRATVRVPNQQEAKLHKNLFNAICLSPIASIKKKMKLKKLPKLNSACCFRIPPHQSSFNIHFRIYKLLYLLRL